jgi:hypothetical protein
MKLHICRGRFSFKGGGTVGFFVHYCLVAGLNELFQHVLSYNLWVPVMKMSQMNTAVEQLGRKRRNDINMNSRYESTGIP